MKVTLAIVNRGLREMLRVLSQEPRQRQPRYHVKDRGLNNL